MNEHLLTLNAHTKFKNIYIMVRTDRVSVKADDKCRIALILRKSSVTSRSTYLILAAAYYYTIISVTILITIRQSAVGTTVRQSS